jgi:imidazolonepropionase-like amidohydrolase
MHSLPTTLRRRVLGVVLAVAASAPAVLGAQQGTWALTNARIETVTKGVIEKGTILVRDGLIIAVGAEVMIPADARVVDYAKRTITPALIDLTSSLGLSAAPAGGGGGGGGGRGAAGGPSAASAGAEKFNGFDPNRSVTEEVKVSAADTRAAREGGVAVALVAPSRGALRGMSVLVPMRDSANGFDAVKVNVAQHFGFSGGGGGFGGGGGANAAGERLPGTIMGVIAYQRQALYDARRYGLIVDRWKADPTGIARPANDPELESLVAAARGQMPIFYDTPQENDIRRAVKMAKEFDLKLTLTGVTEGFKAVDALAGHNVVISTNFPQPSAVTGWSYRNAMRQSPGDSAAADKEARKAIEGNAATLHKAGVKFALASGGSRAADFVTNIRKAVAAGLPADVALQAVTIRAAELAGMGKALGSIEVGKIANFVVTENGNIISDSARVRAVFVDGVKYDVASQAPAPAAGGRGGRGGPGGTPGATPAANATQIAGTWRMTIDSPQGVQSVSATFTQNGSSFSGKISGLPTGDAEISNGRVDGNRASWSLALSFGAQSFNLDFNGDITGNRMTGSVALGPMGNAPFTGEKTP